MTEIEYFFLNCTTLTDSRFKFFQDLTEHLNHFIYFLSFIYFSDINFIIDTKSIRKWSPDLEMLSI